MNMLRTFLMAMVLALATTAQAEPENRFIMFNGVAQPDGKVIRVGMVATNDLAPIRYSMGVSRHNADGTADATFSGGFVTIEIFGSYEWAESVAVASDGSIFVGGNAWHPAWDDCYPALCGYYPTIVKLRPDGTLDPNFNGSGRLVLQVGDSWAAHDGANYATLSSVTVRPDGKVDAVSADDGIMARINPDGSLDRSEVANVQPLAINGHFQGLWWGGPQESGWNVFISHQQDLIFATWATYENGQPTWYSMTAGPSGVSSYSGTLYKKVTANYGLYPFLMDQPTEMVSMGTATLSFSGESKGHLSLSAPDGRVDKDIARFGAQAICANNFTDLWIADPPSEDTDPVAAIAQTDTNMLVVTWLTFDGFGAPRWLFGTAAYTGGDYAGALFRTAGPAGVTFDPASVSYSDAGPLTIEVTDARHLRINTLVDNVPYSRTLKRYVFRADGTRCAQ